MRTLPPGSFDFVYASHGVLRWIPNLRKWARNAASLLKHGGFLYLFETHPLVYQLGNVNGCSVYLSGDFFDERPREKVVDGTHTGPLTVGDQRTVVHSNWTLGSIVSAIADAGLCLDFLHEHKGCCYSRKGLITRRRDVLWYLDGVKTAIPLSFSIKAVRK